MGPSASDAPDVSVIVIVFNDAARLPTAVRSVLRQTLRNLEVLIVDDASTDATPTVAAALCADDPRVRYVRLPTNSGGCGTPRNAGMDEARAANVMFLDSDDRFERHACKNLLEAREDADADFAMGLVRRYHTDLRLYTPWYQPLFEERRIVEGIADDPQLIRDTLSVNKLYRRSFLTENNLVFPGDLHYEDQLFTIQAYHRAHRIAVIPEHVYTWRVFGSGGHRPDSITNQLHQVANVRSRVAVNRRIDDYLTSNDASDLLWMKRTKFLEHDMRLYLQQIIRREPEVVIEILAEAEPYLRSIPMEHFLDLPHALRAAYGMAFRGDIAGLRQAMLLDRMNVLGCRFRRHEGHTYLASSTTPAAGDTSPVDHAYATDAPENLLLQVDGMPLLKAPFGTFHLHSGITSSQPLARALRLSGTTLDTLGKLKGRRDWRMRLVARREQHRASVRVPITITNSDDNQVDWHVDLKAGSALFRRVTSARWKLSVEIRMGERSMRSPLLWPVHVPVGRPPIGLAARIGVGTTASIGPDQVGTSLLTVRSKPGPGRRWVPHVIKAIRTRRLELKRVMNRHGETVRSNLIYPALRRIPLNPRTAVFEANLGTVFGDSPKYVYEAMRRLRPELDCVWVLPAGARRPAKDVEVVQRGSFGYRLALSRATYWVDNQTFPWYVQKRPGQHYLQTWHGIPLKKMGRHTGGFREADLRPDRGVGAWDHLCVPNPYFERTLGDGFAFTGDAIRWGTPRNDPLVNGSVSSAQARKALDLPKSARIVLYAPTFREHNRSRKEPVTVPFDVTAVLEGLGPDTYLLLRPHYLNRIYVPPAARHQAIDVGDVQDINLLYLAADVLVTDYSSVMFDFALLGRPIVFFTYDYDDYVGTRGTYFDLREEAPGTIATDTEELVAALQSADADRARNDIAYRRFVERYCGREDGRASDRAARRLLGLPPEATR